ncbi:flagellar hook-length control protein FliK [Dechloromonas sp. ZS-1]|uniref:flagellar hook-length control protein FliK n=1 Tax=Dechloromonas sp. ZS-1 TaxID=3138067 RepID=UPI0031FDB4AE
MIPPDVASRLRSVLPETATLQTAEQNRAPLPAQRVPDVLSNLAPGQRILAEIQALLPNGNYRAVVAQRELTLALPFAAKAGDTLELEVVETDGKISLALVGQKGSDSATAKTSDSVNTSFSKTGSLINNLLGEIDRDGGKAKPAALNGNQPLLPDLEIEAGRLAPALKEALTKSGMFYEAHQARWALGEMPMAHLLQEPQGKLSSLTPALSQPSAPQASPPSEEVSQDDVRVSLSGKAHTSETDAPAHAKTHEPSASKPGSDLETVTSRSPQELPSSQRPAIAPELTPLVQQQLNALATQNYVWQGQVWPGQTMQWEITEDNGRPKSAPEDMPSRWQTRLQLTLPNLGQIDARLRLGEGGQLELSLTANSQNSELRLRQAQTELASAMQASGLSLNKFTAHHGDDASA